jgi:hypothetical protein
MHDFKEIRFGNITDAGVFDGSGSGVVNFLTNEGTVTNKISRLRKKKDLLLALAGHLRDFNTPLPYAINAFGNSPFVKNDIPFTIANTFFVFVNHFLFLNMKVIEHTFVMAITVDALLGEFIFWRNHSSETSYVQR